ncbi:MAG: DMT family transporter [Rhodospirillales bacterium]|nr:DMT family transporter [Rhodospirillales bacterium]MCW9039754.1 DMT family transporter [Rhodospirillales bacterium]
MMERRDRLDWRAMALLVVLCASWGVQQVAVKAIIDVVPPLTQAGIRSSGAALLLWIWMAMQRKALFARDGTLWQGLAAGALFGGEFLLIYWGLTHTTASRAVVFLYLSPFVVAIGAHLFIPGERLRQMQVLGLICAFAGIVAAFGESALLTEHDTFTGDVMLIGAAVLWGATTVLIKGGRLAGISAGKTLFYQLGVSAVVLALGAVALGEAWTGELTPLAVASLLYQTVWVAFITYLVWFWLVRHYPAGRLSAFSFLTPLFGVVAGGVLLGEPVTLALIAALILVGTGIYLVNRPERRKN